MAAPAVSAGPVRHELLTVAEAAKRARLGRTTMYAKVMSGEVVSVKVGKLRRVPAAAVDAYIARLLEEQTGQCSEPAPAVAS